MPRRRRPTPDLSPVERRHHAQTELYEAVKHSGGWEKAARRIDCDRHALMAAWRAGDPELLEKLTLQLWS